MFRVDPNPTFTRPVKVRVPSGEGVRTETMKATFRAIPVSAFAQFDLASEEGTRALLKEVIVDMSELEDADGNAIDYSESVRDQVIDMAHARLALLVAYEDAFGKAVEGN